MIIFSLYPEQKTRKHQIVVSFSIKEVSCTSLKTPTKKLPQPILIEIARINKTATNYIKIKAQYIQLFKKN